MFNVKVILHEEYKHVTFFFDEDKQDKYGSFQLFL